MIPVEPNLYRGLKVGRFGVVFVVIFVMCGTVRARGVCLLMWWC